MLQIINTQHQKVKSHDFSYSETSLSFQSFQPFVFSILLCVSLITREPRLPDRCCYGDQVSEIFWFCAVLSSLNLCFVSDGEIHS